MSSSPHNIADTNPAEPWTQAAHTIVLSDVHLSDAEPAHPHNPLWKRFKRARYFIDRSFRRFIQKILEDVKDQGPIELVFNGDLWDFDSVTVLPPKEEWGKTFKLSWLERQRGMHAEEHKSRFKMEVILRDHPVFVQTLREFVLAGHRVVFVIGNHDLELHWPGVQDALVQALDLPPDLRRNVRVCEWFYVSNQDTLIEHGNQYDPYCLAIDPVHPIILDRKRPMVRIPFGNLAGKFMTNGMGLFNPHVDSSYIKETAWEYVVFFYRYVIRTQPFLIVAWFWGAMATLLYSLKQGFLPSLRDPLTVEARVESIAARANAPAHVVRTLKELHAHPAHYNPIRLLQELWLDRLFLFFFIVFVSFEFFSLVSLVFSASFWAFFVPLFALLPAFLFYARTVKSGVVEGQSEALRLARRSAQVARVQRVIHGHTHNEMHLREEGIEILNTGTWSPAFHDPECTQPYGRKCFVWIRKEGEGDLGRRARLFEWRDLGFHLIPSTTRDPVKPA